MACAASCSAAASRRWRRWDARGSSLATTSDATFLRKFRLLTRMVCHTSLLRHCVIPGALPRHSCY
jgi:hypothetical protein